MSRGLLRCIGMQRVRLLGELGELFGAEHEYYNLRRPTDAIKLLCINKPAFKDYLLKSEENGVGFKVLQADAEMGYEELLLPLGQRDLVIAPVIAGSGGGTTGKILAGVGLIAVSFLLPGAGLFGATSIFGAAASAGVLTTLGTVASAVGASLILGGVSEIISPQPATPQLTGGFGGNRFGSRNRTNGPVSVTSGLDGQQSYAYTGAVNTVGIGATVPLAYGKVLIGSHLLRSKLQVTDESDPLLKTIKKPGADTVLVGGEKLTTKFDDVSGATVKRVGSTYTATSTFKSSYAPASGITPYENLNIDLKLVDDQTTTQYIKHFGPEAAKKFNVVLAFNNGLFDTAGDKKTTLVDAYVTYKIEVYKSKTISDAKLMAVDQATIQGLLVSSTPFAWMHKMELFNHSETWNTVVLTILDTNAVNAYEGSSVNLTLKAIGYDLSKV